MRIFLFSILISIFASCDHPKKPYVEEHSWLKRTVKLDNDLGVLTIRLPKEFDTFLFSKIYTDPKCGEYFKREFYRKGFIPSVHKYSDGIIWHIDSIYSFSVERWITSDCQSNSVIDSHLMNNIKGRINLFDVNGDSKQIKANFSRIEKIGNRDFINVNYNGLSEMLVKSKSKFEPQTLEAITCVNGQILQLNFQCAASNCDSFIPKMYKALKTVEIKPN